MKLIEGMQFKFQWNGYVSWHIRKGGVSAVFGDSIQLSSPTCTATVTDRHVIVSDGNCHNDYSYSIAIAERYINEGNWKITEKPKIKLSCGMKFQFVCPISYREDREDKWEFVYSASVSQRGTDVTWLENESIQCEAYRTSNAEELIATGRWELITMNGKVATEYPFNEGDKFVIKIINGLVYTTTHLMEIRGNMVCCDNFNGIVHCWPIDVVKDDFMTRDISQWIVMDYTNYAPSTNEEIEMQDIVIDVKVHAALWGVSNEQAAKEIQEYLFKLGYTWYSNPTDVQHTYADTFYARQSDGVMRITYGGAAWVSPRAANVILDRKVEYTLTIASPEPEYIDIGGKRYRKDKLEEALKNIEEAQ